MASRRTGPRRADPERALQVTVDLYVRAGLALAEGQASRAARLLGRCLAIRPGWSQAHTVLGYAHLCAGRGEEAAAAWRRALELDPCAWQAGGFLVCLAAEQVPDAARSLAAALLDRYRRTRASHASEPRAAANRHAMVEALRSVGDGPGQRLLAEAWWGSSVYSPANVSTLVGLLAWTRGAFADARRCWREALNRVSDTLPVEGLSMLRPAPDEGLRRLLRGMLWVAELTIRDRVTPLELDFPLPGRVALEAPLPAPWEVAKLLGFARGTDVEARRRAVRRLASLPEGERWLAAAASRPDTPRRVRGWISEFRPDIGGRVPSG